MLLPMMQSIDKVVSVQGNIGAGKTTLMTELKRALELSSTSTSEGIHMGNKRVISVDEPVDDWRVPRYRNGTKSALDLFYEDIPARGFWFQVNAFNTRQKAVITAMKDVKADEKVILLSERSMTSDKLFTENLFRTGKMKEEEWLVYCDFYNTVAGTTVALEKIMIYVKVQSGTCHSRLVKRSRNEEMSIPIDYLSDLESMHDEMVNKFESEGGKVIRVDWVDSEHNDATRKAIVDDIISQLKTLCA